MTTTIELPPEARSRARESTTTYVVIHADDYGETVEITRGISAAIDAGTVTSTTIMASMPGTEFALPEARARAERASFGVHLNLCEGRPLEKVPTLSTVDGAFHPKRKQALRAFAGRLDLGEVERELGAQIARVHDAGVRISHLDSHKHLHQLPGVADVVARLAAHFGIERVRCTLESGFWPKGMKAGPWASRAARRWLARRAALTFASRGLRFPERALDIREVMGTEDSEARHAMLRGPGILTELMCHPGTAAADREKPGSCQRHRELEFLTAPEFRALVDEVPLRLRTYWDC